MLMTMSNAALSSMMAPKTASSNSLDCGGTLPYANPLKSPVVFLLFLLSLFKLVESMFAASRF